MTYYPTEGATNGRSFVCDLCGERKRISYDNAVRTGWDWFTQRAGRLVSVCPDCMRFRRAERDALFSRAQQGPLTGKEALEQKP